MKINEILNQATLVLKSAKIDQPRNEALLLLAFALGNTKENICAWSDKKITAARKRRFWNLIKRRTKHEPVAYLLGHKEFYGLDFLVNKHTLIPRPETELLIEEVLKLLLTPYSLLPFIIDIGTGSGAIAITLAKRLPRAKIFATDISDKALHIAKKNAKKHKVKIIFKKGNLLSPLTYNLKPIIYNLIITANLPYLPTKIWRRSMPDVKKYEPRSTLDGGTDGLKYYKNLFKQIKKLPSPYGGAQGPALPPTSYSLPTTSYSPLPTSYSLLPITLFLEIDPSQTNTIKKEIKKHFPKAKMRIKKDLSGKNRVVIIEI